MADVLVDEVEHGLLLGCLGLPELILRGSRQAGLRRAGPPSTPRSLPPSAPVVAAAVSVGPSLPAPPPSCSTSCRILTHAWMYGLSSGFFGSSFSPARAGYFFQKISSTSAKSSERDRFGVWPFESAGGCGLSPGVGPSAFEPAGPARLRAASVVTWVRPSQAAIIAAPISVSAATANERESGNRTWSGSSFASCECVGPDRPAALASTPEAAVPARARGSRDVHPS